MSEQGDKLKAAMRDRGVEPPVLTTDVVFRFENLGPAEIVAARKRLSGDPHVSCVNSRGVELRCALSVPRWESSEDWRFAWLAGARYLREVHGLEVADLQGPVPCLDKDSGPAFFANPKPLPLDVVKWQVIAPGIPEDVFPTPAGECGFEISGRKIFSTVASQKPEDFLMRGTTVMETCRDPLGDTVLAVVTPERFMCKIESYEGFRIARKDIVKQADASFRVVWRTTTMPKQSAQVLLTTDAARTMLPPVWQIVPCPVAIQRGEFIEILSKGYHRHAGGTLVTGGVAEDVSLDHARDAFVGILSDFAFQTPGDYSRGVASLISPALKFGGWIDDDFPLDLSEADKSQAGKSWRFKILAAIYGCRVVAITTDQKGGVGSLDEKVSAALIEGRPFISLQNVRGRVDSNTLEEAIRGQDAVTARALRVSMNVDTRPFLWQMSTNGADLTRDLANRAIVTRICKQPEGYKFQKFAEGDVLAHVKANRPRFLGAVFAVLREWARRGCPRTEETRHDFRGWVQALDYIVTEILGMAPLLESHKAEQERVGNPCLQWLREVARCAYEAGLEGESLKTARLIEPAEEEGIAFPLTIPPRGDEPSYARAGRALKKAFHSDHDEDGVLEVGEYLVERQKVHRYCDERRRDVEETNYLVRIR